MNSVRSYITLKKHFLRVIIFKKILPAELRERFDRLIVKVSTSFLVPVNERPTPLCDPAVLYCERVAGASSPEKINSYRFSKFIIFQKHFAVKLQHTWASNLAAVSAASWSLSKWTCATAACVCCDCCSNCSLRSWISWWALNGVPADGTWSPVPFRGSESGEIYVSPPLWGK